MRPPQTQFTAYCLQKTTVNQIQSKHFSKVFQLSAKLCFGSIFSINNPIEKNFKSDLIET